MIFQIIRKHTLTICLVVCLCIITLLTVVLIVSQQKTLPAKNGTVSMADSIDEHKSPSHSSQSLEQMIEPQFDTPDSGTTETEKTLLPYVIHEDDSSDDDRPETVQNVAVRTISLPDKFTAEYVIAAWKNGKATEQTMIEIMNEYGATQGGGKLYVIERGEFVEEVDEWCFSSGRKVGDYAIIETVYGYTICFISGFNEDDNDSVADWNDNTPSYEDIGVTFEQYTLAGMISDDPLTYCAYIIELDETLAKGSYGIDLQKEKATEYVNNLPLDYGQRIILFKIQFPSDTTYCNDIVDYINEREDISYDDAVFILEELGFAVFEDGTVKW